MHHLLLKAAASQAQSCAGAAGLDAKFDTIQLIPAANGYDSHSAQKDTCHLPNIQKATGCEYASMLFFDDERGNVTKVRDNSVRSARTTAVGLTVWSLRVICFSTAQE
jgi:hypothetical protein